MICYFVKVGEESAAGSVVAKYVYVLKTVRRNFSPDFGCSFNSEIILGAERDIVWKVHRMPTAITIHRDGEIKNFFDFCFLSKNDSCSAMTYGRYWIHDDHLQRSRSQLTITLIHNYDNQTDFELWTETITKKTQSKTKIPKWIYSDDFGPNGSKFVSKMVFALCALEINDKSYVWIKW